MINGDILIQLEKPLSSQIRYRYQFHEGLAQQSLKENGRWLF